MINIFFIYLRKYSYNNIYFKGLYNTLIIYPIANTKKIILYNEKSCYLLISVIGLYFVFIYFISFII
ncbi:hypothetical protein PFNF135_01218 [Plasmodium falciparum NF135/5.C10]|uniref:Uncharacterized protein n=1 Tax=Plasmodium falciparum NF135/5.C10 TaxID=1036726 RepID=W4ING4_PLAFA|nr:hypothetical protein PFNF135_01218 [Plasmodium falciparum NF135/5.C10]